MLTIRSIFCPNRWKNYRNCISGVPGLPVARNDVLVGREFGEPHRAPGVELLGRDSDLGAESELASVGEGRRDVDIDARRVGPLREQPRCLRILGDDRLAVARGVAFDVARASSSEPTVLTASL